MRIFAVFPLLAVLSGCAQMFDSNLFKDVDTPPKLSSSAMASASLTDIQNDIADPNSASAFYQQLQSSPSALTALQGNLTGKMNAATGAAQVDVAQTLVLVTANGSGTVSVVNAAIQQASNLKSSSSSSITAAVISLMAGKTTAEIAATLTQFETMQTAFYAMQMAAEDSTTHEVDSSVFYGTASASTQGNLAQIGLVSAAADAMIQDAGGSSSITALAQSIHDGTFDDSMSHANIDLVSTALSSAQTVTNPYAYLSAVKSVVTVV